MTKALNLLGPRTDMYCADKDKLASSFDSSTFKPLKNTQSSRSGSARQNRRLPQYARQKIEGQELRNQILLLRVRLAREALLQRKRQPSQSTWEQLARCYRNSLESAKTRRKWLRKAIVGKKALITDLIALIHQQLQTASIISIQSHGLYDGIFLQPTDDLLYAMYIHELQDVYLKTDDIFRVKMFNKAKPIPYGIGVH